MTDELEQAMRRTYRYWYEDGLAEIAAGGLFLLGGLVVSVIALLTAYPPESTLAVLVLVLGMIVLGSVGTALVARLINRAVTAVKNRVTYPRTGYVAYRPGPVKRRGLAGRLVLAGVAFVVSMLLSGLLSAVAVALQPPDWLFSMAMVQGVVIGIGLFSLGRQLRVTRFQILAGISLLVGTAIALGMPSRIEAQTGILYFAIMGIVLIASGLITLVRYLRQTEPAGEL